MMVTVVNRWINGLFMLPYKLFNMSKMKMLHTPYIIIFFIFNSFIPGHQHQQSIVCKMYKFRSSL